MSDPPKRAGKAAQSVLSVAAIAASLAIAVLAYQGRRGFIADFFHRTEPVLSARPALPPSSSPDVGAAPRVRVVLIDGLDMATANTLSGLNRICAAGWDLRVDVGFPTVSLPIQTVLWTGLTQEQAGVRYVIKRLDPPPPQALPAQVPGSTALAELHPYLIHSFGFETAEPAGDKLSGDEKKAWAGLFDERARTAVASDSRLVFVHLGRVDVAGHKRGRDSKSYREAASWADALLASLHRARDDEGTRWFILSDHGHLAGGGHAGAEDQIRLVRACIVGSGIESTPPGPTVHLVDVSHSLFSSAGIVPPTESAGRPVRSVAAGDVALGTALPSPASLPRLLIAIIILSFGIALTAAACGRRLTAWPWWLPVAYLGVVVTAGVPTMSMPMIYPPQGRDIYLAAVPGLLVLAIAIVRVRGPLYRRLLGQLLIPMAAALAAWVAAGGPQALASNIPPLARFYTAHASVLLVITYVGSLAAVLAALVSFALSWFDRDSAEENQRKGS